eukprot:scaffold273075_cov21-Tisochrysis_lutea.AAC.1
MEAVVPPLLLAGRQTWWTIDARAPEPSSEVESQMERALAILTQLIGMKLLVGPCRSLLDLFYA